jgi:iron-sulfur cluster repair protein YtfE (RIC family)
MDAKLAAWRKKHQNEVDKVERLIEDMGALAPEDAPWLTKLKAVHANLAKHIREEEQDIFPRIKKVWNEIRLKPAGTGMKAKKLKPTAARRVA